jgi:CBS domain-containing membrane protein
MPPTASDTPRPPWWQAFWPAPQAVDARERLRGAGGAGIGILITAIVGHLAMRLGMPAWIVAPMGASAVLVFAVPASPLAQPWSVVGGNTLSAAVGIVCATWGGSTEWAAAAAVAGAIGLMFPLRCLHPPGGASALLMVVAGVTDPRYAIFPVLLNSLLLTSVGVVYNNLTGRRYPHAQLPAKPSEVKDDLDAVLARYNQVLDISRDDLQALLEQTRSEGYQRRLAELQCSDVMSRDPITVEYGTSLQEAWALLREKRIKALPVVDTRRRIIGIVTLADFMRTADLDLHEGFGQKLKQLIRSTGRTHSDKPEVVGQIMARTVRVASEHRKLVDLVPLFGSSGHHHIPIIGEGERLVGILTQSDVVAALAEPPAR